MCHPEENWTWEDNINKQQPHPTKKPLRRTKQFFWNTSDLLSAQEKRFGITRWPSPLLRYCPIILSLALVCGWNCLNHAAIKMSHLVWLCRPYCKNPFVSDHIHPVLPPVPETDAGDIAFCLPPGIMYCIVMRPRMNWICHQRSFLATWSSFWNFFLKIFLSVLMLYARPLWKCAESHVIAFQLSRAMWWDLALGMCLLYCGALQLLQIALLTKMQVDVSAEKAFGVLIDIFKLDCVFHFPPFVFWNKVHPLCVLVKHLEE